MILMQDQDRLDLIGTILELACLHLQQYLVLSEKHWHSSMHYSTRLSACCLSRSGRARHKFYHRRTFLVRKQCDYLDRQDREN